MAIRLVQNINTNNNKKKNFLLNVPCKKRWHFANTSNRILSIVTNDNNILKSQSHVEHNDCKIKLGKISRSKKIRAIELVEGQGVTKKYHKVPKTKNKSTKIIKGANE
jgi:hypothetical protein